MANTPPMQEAAAGGVADQRLVALLQLPLQSSQNRRAVDRVLPRLERLWQMA
jgi:hypothetical protein